MEELKRISTFTYLTVQLLLWGHIFQGLPIPANAECIANTNASSSNADDILLLQILVLISRTFLLIQS